MATLVSWRALFTFSKGLLIGGPMTNNHLKAVVVPFVASAGLSILGVLTAVVVGDRFGVGVRFPTGAA